MTDWTSQLSKAKTAWSKNSETLPSCLNIQPSVPRHEAPILGIVAELTVLQLYIAGNVPDAGQEEKFPTPDNHSKMRRSVENAEHVGLYLPRTFAPAVRHPEPSSPKTRRRVLRRTAKPSVEARRRNGFYLPPARGDTLYPSEVPDSPPPRPSPRRRRPVSSLVDTNSPYDPFAGNPRPFS